MFDANLYVSDTGNHTIRKISIATPTATVTTMAGTARSYDEADGIGTAAMFYNPSGLATDGTHIYVADAYNHSIRRIGVGTRVVTTLAGAGSEGITDATGSAARFDSPWGMTSDGTNLFIADSDSHTIRKIVISTGAVTTIAGSPRVSGSTNGTGSAARFKTPRGITTDGTNLYVADRYNYTVRKDRDSDRRCHHPCNRRVVRINGRYRRDSKVYVASRNHDRRR